jgi:hypothetical protein
VVRHRLHKLISIKQVLLLDAMILTMPAPCGPIIIEALANRCNCSGIDGRELSSCKTNSNLCSLAKFSTSCTCLIEFSPTDPNICYMRLSVLLGHNYIAVPLYKNQIVDISEVKKALHLCRQS